MRGTKVLSFPVFLAGGLVWVKGDGGNEGGGVTGLQYVDQGSMFPVDGVQLIPSEGIEEAPPPYTGSEMALPYRLVYLSLTFLL